MEKNNKKLERELSKLWDEFLDGVGYKNEDGYLILGCKKKQN
jgi:hypothetical protein